MAVSKLRLVGKSAAENGLSRTVNYLSQFTQDEETQRYQCTYDTLNKFLGELVDCTSSLYSYLDSKNQIHLDEEQLEFVRQHQIEVSASRRSIENAISDNDVITVRREDLTVIIAGVVQALGVNNIQQSGDKSEHKVKKNNPKRKVEEPKLDKTAEKASKPNPEIYPAEVSASQIQGNDLEEITVPFDGSVKENEKEGPKRRSFDKKPLWDSVYWYKRETLPEGYSKNYKIIINSMTERVSSYTEDHRETTLFADNISEVMKMMDEYFNIRFAFNRKDGHKFYPELYTEYLVDFCIGYANAYVEGTLEDFKSEFSDWKGLVRAGKCKYSAPKSVGWIFRDFSNPKTATPSVYINKTSLIFAQYLWQEIQRIANPTKCVLYMTHKDDSKLTFIQGAEVVSMSKLAIYNFVELYGYQRINAVLGFKFDDDLASDTYKSKEDQFKYACKKLESLSKKLIPSLESEAA